MKKLTNKHFVVGIRLGKPCQICLFMAGVSCLRVCNCKERIKKTWESMAISHCYSFLHAALWEALVPTWNSSTYLYVENVGADLLRTYGMQWQKVLKPVFLSGGI